jgi:hypothetical protein
MDGKNDVSRSRLSCDDGRNGTDVLKEDLSEVWGRVEDERDSGGEELAPGFGAGGFRVDEGPVEVDGLDGANGSVDEGGVDGVGAKAFQLLAEDVGRVAEEEKSKVS